MADTRGSAVQGPNGQPSGQGLGEPVSAGWRGGWREGTLTRAQELKTLTRWVADTVGHDELALSIKPHLDAAIGAATCKRPFRGPRTPSLFERAKSNLDAAEALLINRAPPDYVLGQMPSLLNHVERHLPPTDPRRKRFEHIIEALGFADSRSPGAYGCQEERIGHIRENQGQIASIVRGASSAGLREQLRVRSFRNVVVGTIVLMSFLVTAIGLIGLFSPSSIPLCFQPEREGRTMVVCPTAQSPLVPVDPSGDSPDIDDVVKRTAAPQDLLVVEVVGLAAASVAAAAAIRRIRGSSERYGLPVALTVLKLPTGALTAFLGLLLMRGQFVPGLSALDTSAQILAWALVFGYAQQLFTRFVDQQAHTVLDSVRGGTESEAAAEPKTGAHVQTVPI